MASSSRKPKAKGKERAEGEEPHFFKIILEDHLRAGKIGIPKKFVRKYGKFLSTSAFLEVPTGAVWKVDMKKHGDRICFLKGWQEFADYYDLEDGHYLVFKYQGNSHFSVLIFDMSATEIDYPFDTNGYGDKTDDDSECQVLEMDETKAVEISDDISAASEASDKSPEVQTEWSLSSQSQGGISVGPSKGGGEGMSAYKASSRKRSLSADEKDKVLLRAGNFKSENPFAVVSMQPSYIGSGQLHLPFAFAQTYFSRGHGNINLRTSDGRAWPLQYRLYEKRSKAQISGWRKFSRDNNLQVDDACVFELLKVKSSEITMNIFIFRASEDAYCHQPAEQVGAKRRLIPKAEAGCSNHKGKMKMEKGKSKMVFRKEKGAVHVAKKLSPLRKSKAFERASRFTSNHPSFMIVITGSLLTFHTGPTIPRSFCKRYINLEHGSNTGRLQTKDKLWPVKLCCSARRVRVTSGWLIFAKENDLRVGDICIFEMIKRDDMLLEVTIFRDSA